MYEDVSVMYNLELIVYPVFGKVILFHCLRHEIDSVVYNET